MRTLWNPAVYWPLWLAFFTAMFLLREVWALATGHPEATLSAWVWRVLRITSNEPVSSWSAADYLVCGCWLVLVSWLTFHFFFRRFT